MLLTALAAAQLLRHKSAATRRLLWNVATSCLLLLPALELALPDQTLIRPSIALSGVDYDADAGPPATPGSSTGPGVPAFGALGPEGAASSAVATPSSPTRNALTEFFTRRSLTRGIALVWLSGVVVVLGMIALSWIRIIYLAAKAAPVTDKNILDARRDAVERLGVEREVSLRLSGEAVIPMAWGILRPTIVLPRSAKTWTSERLESVLLHEMAHIRSGDPLGMSIASLASAIHWFNPLAWTAARRFESEGEECCDNLVVSAGRPAADYATDLLELAKSLQDHTRFPATAAFVGESELSDRLRAVLAPSRERSLPTRGTRRAVRITALGMVFTLAALRPDIAREVSVPGLLHIAEDVGATFSIPSHPAAPAEREPSGSATTHDQPSVVRDSVSGDAGPIPRPLPAVTEAITESGEVALLSSDALPIRLGAADASRDDYRAILALTADQLASHLRTDSSADYRRRMAWGLHKRGSSGASALALALRTDPNAAVREMAAWALGESRGGRASDLVHAVLNDVDAEVRASAFWALEQVGVGATAPALEAAMLDPHSPLRRRSLWYAGSHHIADRIPQLVEALSHPDAESRRTAAWSLGTIRAREHSQSLIPLLSDTDSRVRQAAAWALHRFDNAESRAAMAAVTESSAEVRHILARVERTGRPVDWSWTWTTPRPRTRP